MSQRVRGLTSKSREPSKVGKVGTRGSWSPTDILPIPSVPVKKTLHTYNDSGLIPSHSNTGLDTLCPGSRLRSKLYHGAHNGLTRCPPACPGKCARLSHQPCTVDTIQVLTEPLHPKQSMSIQILHMTWLDSTYITLTRTCNMSWHESDWDLLDYDSTHNSDFGTIRCLMSLKESSS